MNKLGATCLLAGLLALAGCSDSPLPLPVDNTPVTGLVRIESAGLARTYYLVVPDDYDPADPAVQARYPDLAEYMGTSPPYMGPGIARERPNHY